MKFEESINQKSKFPKLRNPDIFISTKGLYKTFGIQNLYHDLFVNVESFADSTFIVFPNGHEKKTGKDMLSFLLPGKIFEYIEERVKENDYKEFVVAVHKNNKIANLMQDIFFGNNESYSGKMFAESFRHHFITLLKDAYFSPYLSAELDNIAKTIVPSNISKEAYNKFKDLKSLGHKGLSIAIANIFASAMLGLFSMKHDVELTTANQSGSQYAKTYLLNELGMKYIWTPDLITTSYEKLFEIQQLYKYGEIELSYKKGLDWLNNNQDKVSKEELAKAFQLIGLSLYRLATKKMRGFEGKEAESMNLLHQCISTHAADSYVYWFLFECYREENFKKAIDYLKIAFAQNYAKAVIEVSFLYLRGEKIIEDITDESLLNKIDAIIKEEQNISTNDIGKCLYLRGRISRNQGNESEAQKDFKAAARKGNERAKKELVRKERNTERNAFPSFSNQPKVKCCYANSLTGNNYQIVTTFPNDEWALFAPMKTALNGIRFVRNVDEFIEVQNIGKFEFCRPKIVFLFMSEDKNKNLNECLELLDKLFNAVLDMNDRQKWELIDNTYIYVSANYETASMLIDANMSQMGKDIYFKVHIADENRDSVHKLLCDAPLFLPALNGSKLENFTKVVLFGSSEINYSFIKESIASAYLGENHPIDITLLGENADTLERRFQQECPGVFDFLGITCIRPKFIKCSIKETDFPRLILGQSIINSSSENPIRRKDMNNDIAETLKYGNYFIVDYADDLENIRFAMELRTWLLRSRDSFDRAPFIGVKVSNKQNSYLTSHLTLTGQAAGNSYYNKYDLFPFGISAQTYHYENIIEDPVLNRIALLIHKFYYLDNDLDKNDESKLIEALKKCQRSAENDFYSYSYNADSSISTAIGLCYRFFTAGCVLSGKEKYLNYGALKNQELLIRFENQMNNKLKEMLAKNEQSRWNSFMLIRGWLPADANLVKAYEEQSSGFAHKHTLAKLHPFIKEWDDLDDPELEKVLGILKSKTNYNKKPQVTTRKSIEDTTRFFRTEFRENEKSH
jgi:hypothetical protein